MRISILLVFLSFVIPQIAISQSLSFDDNAQALHFYGDVMVNALDDNNRVIAANEFESLFEIMIAEEGSFEKTLEDLKFISIQYSEDKAIRFISWQVKESEAKYSYRSYLQTADSKFQKFTNDNYVTEADILKEYTRNWPAQLVYKIKDVNTDQGKSYIVFGMKQIDKFNKVKIADVLQLSDGNASFGSPLFVKNPESPRPNKSNRVVLTYSADANASLNYNPGLDLIVFDNVIPQGGMMPGQGMSNFPDGSYQAYKFENGQWNHVDKLYNTIMSEAPRPNPVTDKKGDGLFGKKPAKKKKRN